MAGRIRISPDVMRQRATVAAGGSARRRACDPLRPYNDAAWIEGSSYMFDSRLAAAVDEDGGVLYVACDELGSPTHVFDEAGALLQSYAYDEFGVQEEPCEGRLVPFGFAGYEIDGTGMLFAQARSYDPRTGRFCSEDVLRGDPARPQTLNRYAYCRGNPVGLVDRDGREAGSGNLLDQFGEWWNTCAIAGLYAYFRIDSATSGQSPFLSFAAGICTALAFMALFFVGWILLRNRFGRSMIEALESACDPAECLKRTGAVEVGLKPPYDEFEAGIIARKGIALHEVGDCDHARNVLFLLKDSALKGKDAQGQSVSCLWAWILAEALGETSRAEAYRSWLAGYAGRVKSKGLQKALIQRIEEADFMDEAKEKGLWMKLAEHFAAKFDHAGEGQVRLKVESKMAEATCFEKLGDSAAEKGCLEYVASNGNGLRVAKFAQDLLTNVRVDGVDSCRL